MYSTEDRTSVGEIYINRQFYIQGKETHHWSHNRVGMVGLSSQRCFQICLKCTARAQSCSLLRLLVFQYEICFPWVRNAGWPVFTSDRDNDFHHRCYEQNPSFCFHFAWLCLETFLNNEQPWKSSLTALWEWHRDPGLGTTHTSEVLFK